MNEGPLAVARRVLEIEAEAIRALINRLDERLGRAVDLVERCRGRVYGHLGVLDRGDVVIALSNSGAGQGTPDATAAALMTPPPKTVGRSELAASALDLMERHGIPRLVIVGSGDPTGSCTSSTSSAPRSPDRAVTLTRA